MLSVFKQLANTELCKTYKGIIDVVGALMSTTDWYGDALATRGSMETKSLYVDSTLTVPLAINDVVTRIVLSELIDGVNSSSDIYELYTRLSPFCRATVYSQAAGIFYFFSYPIDMMYIPDSDALGRGFRSMADDAPPVMEVFKPNMELGTALNYNLPPKSDFKSIYSTAWYLCASDLHWLEGFAAAYKASTFDVLQLPIHVACGSFSGLSNNMAELYTAGIHALVKNELTEDQYVLLNMIFNFDANCYKTTLRWNSGIGRLNAKACDELESLCRSVDMLCDTVRNATVKHSQY